MQMSRILLLANVTSFTRCKLQFLTLKIAYSYSIAKTLCLIPTSTITFSVVLQKKKKCSLTHFNSKNKFVDKHGVLRL